MDTPKQDQVDQVLQAILVPSGDPKIFTLSLSRFKDLYQQVHGQRSETKIDVVLNGTWALVQFSELCNHRIRVLPDNLFRRGYKLIGRRLYLEKHDFEIAFSSATFFGELEYLTVWEFIKEETQVNGLKAVVLLFLSGIFFTISTSSAGPSYETIKSANEVLIAVAAIFFSMFLLFTVSQNLPLANLSLFKRGLPHRFVQVDKNIAYLAIGVIGLAALNISLASNPVIRIPQTPVWSQTDVDFTVFLNWSSAFCVTGIAILLLTVVQYYFRRVESLYETDLSKELLDEAFEERNKELP